MLSQYSAECPRCGGKFPLKTPVLPDGQSTCPKCEPHDASVLDFLYQFPMSSDIPEVVIVDGWFARVYSSNVFAIHDDDWPTIYDDEIPIDLNDGFVKSAGVIKAMIESEPVYERKLSLAKLRKMFVPCNVLTPIAIFAPTIMADQMLIALNIEYGFAGIHGNAPARVALTQGGAIRLAVPGRMALVGRVQTAATPALSFWADTMQNAMDLVSKELDL